MAERCRTELGLWIWFEYNLAKWSVPQTKYQEELMANATATATRFVVIYKKASVTLLFTAKDEQYNNAVSLNQYLEQSLTFLGCEER